MSGVTYRPLRMICGTTRFTTSTGIAKPIPRGPGRAVDGGVDADEAAAAVEQRAAGVAGVDGGVGLDRCFDRASRRRSGSCGRARRDDAGGERLVEAEGVADGEDFLPDLEVAARADAGIGRSLSRGRVDLENGQVVVGGGADGGRPRRCEWSASVTVGGAGARGRRGSW